MSQFVDGHVVTGHNVGRDVRCPGKFKVSSRRQLQRGGHGGDDLVGVEPRHREEPHRLGGLPGAELRGGPELLGLIF